MSQHETSANDEHTPLSRTVAVKLLTVMLETGDALCRKCLAERAGAAEEALAGALAYLGAQVRLIGAESRCVGCKAFTRAFRIP